MKVTIPTTLQDITLNQWVTFQKTVKLDMTEDVISIHLVSIFCNIPLQDVLTINSKDFKEIVTTVAKTIESTPIFKQRFTYNGIEYGMIPNLDQMTAGEYMDMDKYFGTDPLRFMSVLFRPITKKSFDTYQIEPYKGSNDKLNDAPVEYYLGANVFFYNLKNELLNATNHYFQQLKQADKEVLDKVLLKNGDGINQFTQFLTEISLTSIGQPN
jgi:hypothetical protein